jgi:hypothetical protein
MKHVRKVQEPSTVLQSLLDNPAEVHQADLDELLRAKAALDLARADYNVIAGQIMEMLAMGFPAQLGPNKARLVDGKLEVVPDEDEEERRLRRLNNGEEL